MPLTKEEMQLLRAVSLKIAMENKTVNKKKLMDLTEEEIGWLRNLPLEDRTFFAQGRPLNPAKKHQNDKKTCPESKRLKSKKLPGPRGAVRWPPLTEANTPQRNPQDDMGK